jgi:hypothetical protein
VLGVVWRCVRSREVTSCFCELTCTPLCCCCFCHSQNISKYQDDPEVMKVLEKVTEIFAPQMQQQGMQK